MAKSIFTSFDSSVKVPDLTTEIFDLFEARRGKMTYAAYWDDKNIKNYSKDYNELWQVLATRHMIFSNLVKSGLKKPKK